MKTIKVCIIGAGNISNTRHIPALKKLKNVEIYGVISNNENNLRRTCEKNGISNNLLVNNPENDIETVRNCEWFKNVDAVCIGTPPQFHHAWAKMSLLLGKDTLVEKPMTMNKKEADELIKIAEENNLIFNVVHNFQYTTGMKKINKMVEEKTYGEIVSIFETQFSNKNRRLPSWYNDLPLGLFYDEAAHFIYLLYRHGGNLKIDDAYAQYSKNKKESTPISLSVNATAGKVPVSMYLNFNSPVCEWLYIINFEKRIVVYDLFKDIVISLPTDGEHYAMDVLKNDLRRSRQYWGGFIKNGFKRCFGGLLYGHETILKNFIDAVETRESDENISGEMGRKTIVSMNDIVNKVNKK